MTTSAGRIRKLSDASAAVTLAAWTIVAMSVVITLYFGRDLLIPIALALLLSFVLSPLVSLAKKARLPRGPAVVLVVLFAFAIIGGIGAVIAGQVNQLAGDLPKYQTTMREKAQSLRVMSGGSRTLERAADLLQNLGEEFEKPKDPPAGPNPSAGRPSNAPLPVEVRQPPPSSLDNLKSILGALLHPMATTGIIIVFVIFILLQREDLRNRLMSLAGASDIQRTTAALDDAAKRLSRLFLTQIVLNAGFGFAIGVGLWALGVPGAGLWGVMAAVLRFVPYIGAVIAAVFPLLLAAAVDPGWTTFVATFVLFAVIEPIVGHLIEPMVYGRSTGLSPVAVVVSATFWTALWGPIGLVLATPLTVCLVVLGRHVESLAFLDTLFGDRPALSAPELFYQRMLAGDPVEAAERADEYLRGRSLSNYYEEVAIRGLLLAQQDAARGALDEPRVARIRNSVGDLVETMADVDDSEPSSLRGANEPEALEAIEESDAGLSGAGDASLLPTLDPDELPPAWREGAPVVCIGGRSPLDAATAEIVAQVVSKHGLPARHLGPSSLGRSKISDLDAGGVRVVCLTYLNPKRAAFMRYAVRRLRQANKDALIILACWSPGSEATDLETMRQESGADAVASSLRDVAEYCIAAVTTPREPMVGTQTATLADCAPAG